MTENREWIRTALADLMDVAPHSIDLTKRFRELGLQSKDALQLVSRLAMHLGKPVAATAPWEHPTPEALARFADRLSRQQDVAVGSSRTTGTASVSSTEPIAIVGIGCRLPGGVRDLESYWELLLERRSGVREVPGDRWDLEAYLDPELQAPGKMTTRWGGFLDEVDRFDAGFFGISAREARQMDPQQRLALELVWEALEDSGVDPQAVRGERVGVFVGAMWSDYARLLAGEPQGIDAYTATGQDTSIISGRISYVLGLSGASLTVNTACSSSAVAIHLACQSLRLGESTMALAGGVSLITSPHSTVAMTKFGAMNPDGQCRAFDAGANGYVRSEGGGMLLLKPLSQAILAGDEIHSVILGSAANNDGFSNGLTAPSPAAQEAVVRAALASASIDADSVQYVETHGPGTILGDPIEAGSLGAVYGSARPSHEPLRIGSVKTNLGHLEAAAGVAGLIKAALALRQRVLPANLHFERPNPLIDFDGLRLRVQSERENWPSAAGTSSSRPRAGVNSFGFGGTNCHILLEAPPTSDALLFVLAGASALELRERALRALAIVLRLASFSELASLCRSVAVGRASGAHRVAWAVHTRDELASKLTALLSADATGRVVPLSLSLSLSTEPLSVAFVLPGHGAQWHGMARSLLQSELVFRAEVEACARCVAEQYGWSILEELLAEAGRSRLDQPEVLQLVLLAVQLGLAALWRSWGIEPNAVVGHSMGEVAACVIAGVLSRQDAVCILGERARLLRDHAYGRGTMLVVSVSEKADRARVLQIADGLEFAAENSPTSIVLSGATAAIEHAERQLSENGIRSSRVHIGFASHSSEMDPLLLPLRAALHEVTPQPARIALHSTALDAPIAGTECDAAYWAANLRNPVRYRQAVEALAARGCNAFLELSPHPILVRPTQETLAARQLGGVALASCHRNEDERSGLLAALAELYERGAAARWEMVFAGIPDFETSRPDLAPDLTALFGVSASSQPAPAPALLLFVLSGKTERALRAQAVRLHAHLTVHPELELPDVAYSLLHTRSQFEQRAVIVTSERSELMAALQMLGRGEAHGALVTGRAVASGKVAFVFPGQGSQWVAMGRELLSSSAVFRTWIEACEQALAPHVNWSLLAVLRGDTGSASLERVDVVQPALFAMMVSLSQLLKSLGLSPAAVVGHSQGEIAAACVSGALSLADAARVVAVRARLLKEHVSAGAMAAVELPAAQVREQLGQYGETLSIAAVNGPESTVVSGADSSIAHFVEALTSRGVFARKIQVDYASHSAHVAPIEPGLLAELAELSPQAGTIPLYSTVLSQKISGAELDARYWYRNGRETVELAAALRQLLADGFDAFVEVSPHPVLSLALRSNAQAAHQPMAAVGVLKRDRGGLERVFSSLGELYVQGAALDFSQLIPAGRRVKLPTYAFQRERHWLDARVGATDVRSAGLEAVHHPWLGALTPLADRDGFVFSSQLSLASHAWLQDHAVHGTVLLPGTGMLELALYAAREVGLSAVEELAMEQPLVLRREKPLQLQLTVGAPEEGGRRSFAIHTRAGQRAQHTHGADKTGREKLAP